MNMAQRFVNYFKILLLCCLAVLTTQLVNKKGDIDFGSTVIGLLMVTVVCLAALLIGEVKALKKIPPFAWASLISLVLTTPWCPLSELVLKYTGNVSTGQIGTVILVVAGVSIGTMAGRCKTFKLEDRSGQYFCILRNFLWISADRRSYFEDERLNLGII